MNEKPTKPIISFWEILYIFLSIFFLAKAIVLPNEWYIRLAFTLGAIVSFCFFISDRNKALLEYKQQLERYEKYYAGNGSEEAPVDEADDSKAEKSNKD